MDVVFFVDAGLGIDLVRGLRLLGYTNVEHVYERFPVGVIDEVWLEYVGKNKLAVITKDKMIRKNPKEKAALIKYGIVAFYLGGDKLSIKEMASQLINAWNQMECLATKQQKTGVAAAFVIRPRGKKIEVIPLT